MISTLEELIEESKKLAKAQSVGFQEALTCDPDILKLVKIVKYLNERTYYTTKTWT